MNRKMRKLLYIRSYFSCTYLCFYFHLAERQNRGDFHSVSGVILSHNQLYTLSFFFKKRKKTLQYILVIIFIRCLLLYGMEKEQIPVTDFVYFFVCLKDSKKKYIIRTYTG